MALLTARRQSLSQPSVWKSFQRAVDPSETQCLFDNIQIRQYPVIRIFLPAHDDPALLFRGVILFEPSS